jgi:hypothetical protein
VKPRKPLGLKPLYTTTELARSIGISQYRVERLLKMHRVFVYQIGRSLFVPLSEIQEKLQPLWASLLTDERNRQKAD